MNPELTECSGLPKLPEQRHFKAMIRDRRFWVRLLGGLVVLMTLLVLYWLLQRSGLMSMLSNKSELRDLVSQLGWLGPVAIIAMMIAAIVMSPIPSGPIAMVAGAVYGPLLGTTYVVIGAEAGAIIAFCLSRFFGYHLVRRLTHARTLMAWLSKERSQTGLMVIVFASRLVPFISFDAVSYAAGLTPLAFWRFVIATLVGVIPTAYLITRFGEILISADSGGMTVLLVFVSGITLLPLLAKLVQIGWRKK